MAVAGITPAGSLLTKTGQMQIAGCLLRRRAREARGEGTHDVAV